MNTTRSQSEFNANMGKKRGKTRVAKIHLAVSFTFDWLRVAWVFWTEHIAKERQNNTIPNFFWHSIEIFPQHDEETKHVLKLLFGRECLINKISHWVRQLFALIWWLTKPGGGISTKYRSIGSIGLTTYVTVTGCSMMKEASSHLVDI